MSTVQLSFDQNGNNRSTLLDWLKILPREVVHDHPRLLLDHAWALLWSGQVTALEPHLRDAERVLADSTGSQPNVPHTAGRAMLGELVEIPISVAKVVTGRKPTATQCQRAEKTARTKK